MCHSLSSHWYLSVSAASVCSWEAIYRLVIAMIIVVERVITSFCLCVDNASQFCTYVPHSNGEYIGYTFTIVLLIHRCKDFVHITSDLVCHSDVGRGCYPV